LCEGGNPVVVDPLRAVLYAGEINLTKILTGKRQIFFDEL